MKGGISEFYKHEDERMDIGISRGGRDTCNCHLLILSSRWIKFEEKVEQGGERWSKPHVATLSLHSLFELRTCMEKGSIMLDHEASSLPQLVGKYIVLGSCCIFGFMNP